MTAHLASRISHPAFLAIDRPCALATLPGMTRIEPLNIQIIGNEIAIAWNDGVETYLQLDALRRACPCASCCGEPDALGNLVRPEVRHSPSSFILQNWALVGGYALQPAWADGHATGLFTFMYLRKLGG